MPGKQPRFTKYEAALLLNAYLMVLNGKMDRNEAVKICSGKFRTMAVNKGIEIDDAYRDEKVVSRQMYSMESAYLGKVSNAPALQLFVDVAQLRKKDKKEFRSLLDEAEKMAQDTDADFCRWLSSQVNISVFVGLLDAILEIKEFALQEEFAYVPFFTSLTSSLIEGIKEHMIKTNEFSKRDKNGYMELGFDYLYKYLEKDMKKI